MERKIAEEQVNKMIFVIIIFSIPETPKAGFQKAISNWIQTMHQCQESMVQHQMAVNKGVSVVKNWLMANMALGMK